MTIDVVDLRNFYSQRLGIVARRLINRGIRAHWPNADGLRVAGLGYPTPYLGLFREDAERCLAFMPAAQGVMKWPTGRPALAALVDEFALPLAGCGGRSPAAGPCAGDVGRSGGIAARGVARAGAGGRMIAVMPNRRGLWARTDTTPFGHGRPYSRAQITQLLRETWFTPTAWGEALYVPPFARGWFLRSAMAWERMSAAVSSPFAGVHIVDATKQVYRAIPVAARTHAADPVDGAGAGAVAVAATTTVPASTELNCPLNGPPKPRSSDASRSPMICSRRASALFACAFAALRGNGCAALGTRAGRTAAPAMAEALAAAIAAAIGVSAGLRLRLAAGDEGRQAIDVAPSGVRPAAADCCCC